MAKNNHHDFTKQLVYHLLCSQLIFIEHLLFSRTKNTLPHRILKILLQDNGIFYFLKKKKMKKKTTTTMNQTDQNLLNTTIGNTFNHMNDNFRRPFFFTFLLFPLSLCFHILKNSYGYKQYFYLYHHHFLPPCLRTSPHIYNFFLMYVNKIHISGHV